MVIPKKYPQNLHTHKEIFIFLKTPKNIKIQNFEPQKNRAYVCIKFSEYPPPPSGDLGSKGKYFQGAEEFSFRDLRKSINFGSEIKRVFLSIGLKDLGQFPIQSAQILIACG